MPHPPLLTHSHDPSLAQPTPSNIPNRILFPSPTLVPRHLVILHLVPAHRHINPRIKNQLDREPDRVHSTPVSNAPSRGSGYLPPPPHSAHERSTHQLARSSPSWIFEIKS